MRRPVRNYPWSIDQLLDLGPRVRGPRRTASSAPLRPSNPLPLIPGWPSGKSRAVRTFCPVPARKIFYFRFSENCVLIRPSRPDAEGRSANRHQTWGGMRWTRQCRVRLISQGEAIRERCGVRDERRCRGRRSRVVLAPHGRRQGPDGIARSPTGLRGAVPTDRRGQHLQWSPGRARRKP